ncbi:MAG: NAD-dependent epimerase/dehydratase family protein [Acidimicrobiia bacterium]|nr:NAD-dependent epimerase/dehydratase family protein [Acidimicrobiia bacterium]
MKIVVTGGAGFIGSNLCHALAERTAHDVIAVDDLSTGFRENLGDARVELREGSYADADLMDEACAGAGAIVHLGARGSVPKSVADPVATHERNASGTIAVLEAARRLGKPHVVVASSSSVYGANPELPKHEGMATRPVSPYGASKLATEWYAMAYQHSYGLPVLALRFFNVYGPRQPAAHDYAAVMPAFIRSALDDVPLTVYGDGEQTRDFTHVTTVCDVIIESIEGRVTHDIPVNLAFGTQISLLEIIALLRDITGRPCEVDHVSPRPGDVRHTRADPTLLMSLFPDLQPVDFRPGLEQLVAWWREQA